MLQQCKPNKLAMAVMMGGALLATGLAEAASRTQSLIEEVVVTATKKSDGQALQEAPVAVNVFSEEHLYILKVDNIEGLSYRLPNVNLDSVGSTRGNANFSIRGFGVNSSSPSTDPSVGTFLDGVYLATNSAVITDLFDVEGVEVLRGPQGLLFGRNVTGGAVLIRSARPTEEFEAYVKTRFETGLDQTYSAAVSGALSDNVLGRLAVYYRDDDGWFDNEVPGGPSEVGALETRVVRPSFTFNIGESEHNLVLEYGEMDGDGAVSQGMALFDDHDVGMDFPGATDIEWWRFALESTWDVSFGDGTLTNIFGWRNVENYSSGDTDSSPFNLFIFSQNLKQEQFSNELRYNGTFGNVDVVAGVYYLEQELEAFSNRFVFGGVLDVANGGRLDHTAWGVFTQADFHVTDALTLTAGVRYSAEEKDTGSAPTNAVFPVGSTNPICSATGPFTSRDFNCSFYFEDNEDWGFVTPKLGFSWQVADDALIYGHYSKGFRSGGMNFRANEGVQDGMGNIIAGNPFYDKEEVNSFELGLKSEFNDGQTLLNLALFYTEVQDLQREVDVVVNNVNVQVVANVADATMQGAELEFRQQLAEGLLLNVTAGLLDAEYDSVTPEAAAAGITADLEITRAPEFTAGVNLSYELPVGDNGASLLTTFAYSHRDSWFSADSNTVEIQQVDVFDLFATFYSADEHWTVSLYGKNLTNEARFGFVTAFPPVFPAGTFAGINEGRTYGLEAQYKF